MHKTNHKFSVLSLDQAHEQNNAAVKGVSGTVGLFTDAAALRRWLVSGPQINHMVDELECLVSRKSGGTDKHHEQYSSFQQRELREEQILKEKIAENGNPFIEEGNELFHLTRLLILSLTQHAA